MNSMHIPQTKISRLDGPVATKDAGSLQPSDIGQDVKMDIVVVLDMATTNTLVYVSVT